MLSFLKFSGAKGEEGEEPMMSNSNANGSANGGSNKGAQADSPGGQLASCLRDAATGDGSSLRSKLATLRPRLEESIDQPSPGTPDLLEQDDLCASVISYVQGEAFGTAEDPLCQWMFEWYQTGKPGRRRFVARFLPEMATAFLLQQQRSPRLLGLQAVMIAVYEAEVQSRAPGAAVPQLDLPSSYHTPPRASSAAPASLQWASRIAAPDSLPPGIAALLAGADPSPSLTTMLMPKTIDGNVRAWQSTEIAASAFSEFRSHMATYRTEALESACRCCLGLAAHSCPWALELDPEGEGLGDVSAVFPGLSDSTEKPVAAVAEAEEEEEEQQEAAEGASLGASGPGLRVPMEGRLLEQLCLVLGHCGYRAEGKAGVLAGPPDTPAKHSELLRLARASALVLHTRARADADSAALIATLALVKTLEADATAH